MMLDKSILRQPYIIISSLHSGTLGKNLQKSISGSDLQKSILGNDLQMHNETC